MSFYQKYLEIEKIDFESIVSKTKESDIKNILNKNKLDYQDFIALLSPAADSYLEEMAHKAHQLTIKNFGPVLILYMPLYLSNYCINHCTYCGFSVDNQMERKKLGPEEIKNEAEAIFNKGVRDVVVLTGESRKDTPVEYIEQAVDILKDYFPALSVEIYPLEIKEYERLINRGIDGLTIYQEVYDRDKYQEAHPAGPKRDYRFRLEAPERGCEAGMRRVNIGPLLGLNNWRREVFSAGMHAKYLQDNYLDTEISLSFSRLRPHQGNFEIENPVRDKDLVQAMLASRLFLPQIGINLSTREKAELRDNLIPLGVTRISAESSTVVGGYEQSHKAQQFEISDKRSIEEIREVLKQKGYQLVFKDWHWINETQ